MFGGKKKRPNIKDLYKVKQDILASEQPELKVDNSLESLFSDDFIEQEIKAEQQQKRKEKVVSPKLKQIVAAIRKVELPEVTREINTYIKTSNPLYKKYFKLVEIWQPVLEKVYEKSTIMKFFDPRRLSLDLYATRMQFTVTDYVNFVSAISLTVGFVLLTMFLIYFFMGMISSIWIAILAPIGIMFGIFLLGMNYPKMMNKKRAKDIERQLAFALREMSCLLSAGLGIQSAVTSIAKADYGTLSQEFTLLVAETQSGITFSDAVLHMVERNYSKGLERFGTMVVRTVRSGGELSKAIKLLVEDLTKEALVQMQKFSATLNLVGIFFLFVAAVLPVMLGILSAISSLGLFGGASSALSGGVSSTLASSASGTTVMGLALTYCVGLPMLLLTMLIIIQVLEPNV